MSRLSHRDVCSAAMCVIMGTVVCWLSLRETVLARSCVGRAPVIPSIHQSGCLSGFLRCTYACICTYLLARMQVHLPVRMHTCRPRGSLRATSHVYHPGKLLGSRRLTSSSSSSKPRPWPSAARLMPRRVTTRRSEEAKRARARTNRMGQ